MPKSPPTSFTEKQSAKLRAQIKALEDKCVAAQEAKTKALQANIDAACEKIAKGYRERIAVLSKQLGALTGK